MTTLFQGSLPPRFLAANAADAVTDHQLGEAHAHDEVGRPVAAAGHGHGRRAGPLGEELGHDEPRDWTWAQFEHGHKQHDGGDGQVAHGWHVFLRAQ